MTKNYDLIIFDWDGTLMDSIGKIIVSVQSMAHLADFAMPSESQIRDVIGLSLEHSLHSLFPSRSDIEYQQMAHAYKVQFQQMQHVPSPLFATSEALLQTLTQYNYLLAVATGKARAGLERMLSETSLSHYFTATRCADETKSKPHPQMLLELLEELQIPAHKALMVGDSLHDLNMANNAGVDAVGVSYGAHSAERLFEAQPKAVIHSPIELLAFLQGSV